MKRIVLSLAVFTVTAGPIAPAVVLRAAAPDVARVLADKQEEIKGERKELGSKEVAGYTVKVTQAGDVKAGEEAVFLLVLSGGAGKPKAIRAWVGVESAEGSTKGKCEDEEKEWHAHVEAPKPIPDKAQFWLEVETDAGKKKVSFDYKITPSAP